MDNSLLLCPVCQSEEAVDPIETRDIGVSCRRCGNYLISVNAREMLLQADAPIPPGFSISHAFRWASVLHEQVLLHIETDEASRIIQRRRSDDQVIPSMRHILSWLERYRKSNTSLYLEGWAAILNELTLAGALRRINRLRDWGLITIQSIAGGKIDLQLTERAITYQERVNDRRRRIRRSIQTPREIRSNKDILNSVYVSSLTVTDYKCFRERQLISFATEDGAIARWTFLIGENGVGKTTVLQLVAGLFPSWPKKSRHPSVSAGDFDDIDVFAERHGTSNYHVEAEFHQGRLETSLTNPLITGAMAKGVSLDRLDVQLHLASDSIVFRMSQVATYVAGYSRMCHFPLVVGYGAARTVSKFGLATEKDRAGPTHNLFNPETPLQDPEDWLLRSDYTSRFVQEYERTKKRPEDKLRAALLDILPDVTDISFRGPDELHDRPWVGFLTDQGMMDYRSLSVGYQSTVAWIVDLAIRMIENFSDEEYPLEQPVVVLLDEIDIHLHPRWQRSILGHLEQIFPAAQFIVTTHSPLIIQGATNGNLALLRKEEDHIVVINDIDEVRNFRVDQILTSELFGLKSARPDEVAELFRRRVELLSRPDIERAREEINQLEEKLTELGEEFPEPVAPEVVSFINNLRTS